MSTTVKLFLASSSELKDDRDRFEIFIGRKNKDWHAKGVFLKLEMWEDFLDAMSPTRLQDEYNRAIAECDIFVMLFWTKVGKYTEEEFEHAFKQFKATDKPFIFTYFKESEVSLGSANKKDLMSLWAFQEKLDELGHFYTRYENVEGLLLHFGQQLEKLAANGFIEFKPDKGDGAASGGDTHHADLAGRGAIAQGKGAKAVGAGGVLVGGNNTGDINTGTQANRAGGAYFGGSVTAGGDVVGRDKITQGNRIDAGNISGTGIAIGSGARANVAQGISPGDLEPLFAPLLAVVAHQAAPDEQADAMQQVQELKAETAKGEQADDKKMGGIIEGLAAMVPGAVGTVVSMFATPILKGIVGPVTEYVLGKLKGN